MNVRSALFAFALATVAGGAAAQTITPIGSPCATSVRDRGGNGCLKASSVPELGRLYPITSNLFVDALSGHVGLGTTAPSSRLTVLQGAASSGLGVFVSVDTGYDGLEVRTNGGGIAGLFRSTGDEAGLVASADPALLYSYAVGSGLSAFSNPEDAAPFSRPAVYALADNPDRMDDGVIGSTRSTTSGSGVRGSHAATGGTGAGVSGVTLSTSSGAAGVRGTVNPTQPGGFSAGVRGVNNGTAGSGIGVYGSHAGSGWGVYGAVTGTGRGVYGIAAPGGIGVYGTAGSPGYGVYSAGDMGGSGAKFFVHPHAEDASKEIRFVSLEGNESGTYFRGSGRIQAGRAWIEVPEAFRLVTDPEGLTVQVTPRGDARVWVESAGLELIAVRGSVDVPFDYFVNGVRQGYADFEPVRENRSFVPRQRGVPFGAELAPEVRELLVENGTLQGDYTPDETTAAWLGWTLTDEPRASEATSTPPVRIIDRP